MAVINRPMPRKQSAQIPDGRGTVRIVRHELLVGGVSIETLKSWSKDELSYSAGSSASAVFKAGVKDWLAEAKRTLPMPFIIKTTLVVNGTVLPDAEEFSGVLDTLDFKPMEGVYEVHASSYARILVTTKISETIAGTADAAKYTGQVVEELTKKYGKGLKVQVDPFFMSHTKVGKIYKQQQVKTIKNMPVWDVLQSFAQADNADLFVKGDTLYYVRKPVDATADISTLGNVQPNYVFIYGENLEDLTVRHSPLFSSEVTVTVRSYQPRTQQTYESTKNMSELQINKMADTLMISKSRDELDALNAKSQARMRTRKATGQTQASVAPARIGGKENFTFVVPNASQEDCERIATRIMEDIARKEFVLTIKVLGRPDYNARQYIRIADAPAASVNQIYAIKSIHTSSGVGESGQSQGYTTEMTIVNHTVQTQGASLGV